MGLVVGRDGDVRAGDSASRAVTAATYGRGVLAVAWVLLLTALGLPRLLQPYRANREVTQTTGFFDRRLLEPAKTIEELEVLAREYPDEVALLEKLAYVYAKEIQTADKKINRLMADKAIATYTKILAIDGTRAAVYNNLANVHYTIGQVDEASVWWRAGTR